MNTKGYYLEEFNEYLHELDRAQNTIDCYDLAINGLVNWYEQSYSEEFKPGEILAMELQSYRSYCLNVLKHRSTTVNNKISAIKEYFKFICEKGLISANPAANIKKVKINNQGTERTTFTVQEFHRLKREVFKEQNPLHELILMLLAYTGVRVSEAINMKIEDIDLDRKRNRDIRVLGKGFKERTIPMHPELRQSDCSLME